MLYLSLLFLLVALGLFWMSARQRRAAGLPAGRVIYVDTRAWGPVEQPLYDAVLGLTGKPDYLVEQNGQVIPVEVKSSRAGGSPHDSHIYQLAAYCLLVERQLGKRPPYGILHYPNRTFAIDFTPQLEANLLALLDEIHAMQRRKEVNRSHESPARCSRCGYRHVCDQRLL
jgi:CRISPR-associated exonuclease Cas4